MLIDMHVHILPGVDDGAQEITDSLAMAEVAVKDGISMLVATPHIIRGLFENRKEDILADVKRLNRSLEDSGIDLPILPGAEYFMEPDLPQRLADGELLTINNSGLYLMIELPAALVPENTDQVLYEIQMQGVTPIIAHPERNHVFARHTEKLQSYAERGILLQVTSASITGLFGRSIQKAAFNILEAGACHVLGSDGHSVKGRAPLLSRACQEIARRWGAPYARTLAFENPQRIIMGQSVPSVLPPSKQSFWRRFSS